MIFSALCRKAQVLLLVFSHVARMITSHECSSFFNSKETDQQTTLQRYRRDRQSEGPKYRARPVLQFGPNIRPDRSDQMGPHHQPHSKTLRAVRTSQLFLQICDECLYPACFRSQISCGQPPRIEPSKQQEVTETDMHKLIIVLMAIFFLGDPSLQTLAWLGEIKVYMVAAAIALVSIPFVISQLDG